MRDVLKKSVRLGLCITLAAPFAFGQVGIGPITTGVKFAKKKIGHPASTIAPGFQLHKVVTGASPLENPSGPLTTFGVVSGSGALTEPDENTYLAFDQNPGGPVPGYDYGRHFLFQGHENAGNLAYITRINLDITDKAHRITLLSPVGAGGVTGFNAIDGSVYDAFTKTLLYTQEDGGAVIETNATWPPNVHTLDGVLGNPAFYEGIHPDGQGNLILAEDLGGVSVNIDPTDPSSPKAARQPNSFVYRLVPYDPSKLSAGGKLQALQVLIDGVPVVFHADDPSGDVFSLEQLRLHTLGTSYTTQWVTVHDTAVDGMAAFNPNALAKAALATPFKRPENLQFFPAADYRTFFFDATGDTNALAGAVPALVQRGTWGSIFRVDLNEDNSGTISIFVLGTAEQGGFDNLSFADDHTLLAGEDRGDTLHTQLNRLDSIWAYTTDGSQPPRRFLALGLDKVAASQGDNEPTGVHVSNGSMDPTMQPGTIENLEGARAFFTRQHGENVVYEILKSWN